MKTQLVSFSDYHEPARRLAQKLDIPCKEISVHRFPDGESRVQLPDIRAEHLIICRSLDRPNDKLVELMFTACTARDLGIKKISLVAPYLCYMRQDKAFHPGEAISQKIIGQYLAQHFDNVITVDPHLHRTPDLQSAVPCKQAISLSATKSLGQFLVSHNKKYILIGPDEESEQWVSTIASYGGFDFGIAHKTRLADRQVEITLPELDVSQAEIILVDDMISTGHTMLETAKLLFKNGAASINCLVTHALCDSEVITMLQDSGIESVWSTDSIIHHTNSMHLDSLLAEGINLL